MLVTTHILDFFGKHPFLGIFSGLTPIVMQYIEPANQLLKFAGSGLGIVIAALTLYGKVIDIRKKRKNER